MITSATALAAAALQQFLSGAAVKPLSKGCEASSLCRKTHCSDAPPIACAHNHTSLIMLQFYRDLKNVEGRCTASGFSGPVIET
jgi:hypothetical protein